MGEVMNQLAHVVSLVQIAISQFTPLFLQTVRLLASKKQISAAWASRRVEGNSGILGVKDTANPPVLPPHPSKLHQVP